MDSTKLSESVGDAVMAQAWAAHGRVARDLLVPHRGGEFDKTDGYLLVFESARDAASPSRPASWRSRRHHGKRRTKINPDFALRPSVRCAHCARGLMASWSKGRKKYCPFYRCPKCTGVNIGREIFEKDFVAMMDALRPKPEYLATFRIAVLDVWKAQLARMPALQGPTRDRRDGDDPVRGEGHSRVLRLARATTARGPGA